LEIKRSISDAGSEFLGVREMWINNQNTEHTKPVASNFPTSKQVKSLNRAEWQTEAGVGACMEAVASR